MALFGSLEMEITINPEWRQLLPYALGGALLLILLFNIPFVGRIMRALLSVGVLAFCLMILAQQAPFSPMLDQMMTKLGVNGQSVEGGTIRIRMSPDGHFWARANINGIERRMLIDSGATVTALSQGSAQAAGVSAEASLVPILMKTANGTIRAETGTIARLSIGDMEARDMKAVISPALGDVDILGMNFLGQLASWRVDGRELILQPRQAQTAAPSIPGGRW